LSLHLLSAGIEYEENKNYSENHDLILRPVVDDM